jgi:hypothetical protein
MYIGLRNDNKVTMPELDKIVNLIVKMKCVFIGKSFKHPAHYEVYFNNKLSVL